jgi:hypothetical protein
MLKFIQDVQDQYGNAMPGVQILVTTEAGAQAVLYGDDETTVITNPVRTDASGVFSFKAPNGKYVATTNDSRIKPNVQFPFSVFDPDDFQGLSLGDLAASGGSDLVGFIQAGTGAAVRSVQDELRERVSVKQFEAVGDGVADDTIAFQRAINYVSTLPSGGSIYIPAGRYRLTEPLLLNLTKHITVHGDGQASQLFGASAFGFLLQITVSNNAAYGSAFRDFMISPASVGYTSGISASAANGFTFEGLTIQGQAIGMQFASSYAVRINCKFDVTTSEGVRWTTSAHGANLRGSKFYTCGVTNTRPAVAFTVSSNNLILDDCVFEFNYKAASFQDCTSIRMNGCYIEYCTANDVDFVGTCTGISMEDSWFYAGIATFTLSNANGLSFKRNTVGLKTIALGSNMAGFDAALNATVAGGVLNLNYIANQPSGPGGIPFVQPYGPDAAIQYRMSSKGAADVTVYTGSQGVLAGVFQHVPSGVVYPRFEPGLTGDMPTIRGVGETNTGLRLSASGTGLILSASAHRFNANVGFYGTTPIAKPTITGSRGGNAALASLMTALAAFGIVTDSTTA